MELSCNICVPFDVELVSRVTFSWFDTLPGKVVFCLEVSKGQNASKPTKHFFFETVTNIFFLKGEFISIESLINKRDSRQ